MQNCRSKIIFLRGERDLVWRVQNELIDGIDKCNQYVIAGQVI